MVVQHRQYIVRSEDNGVSFDNATSAGVANNLYGVGFGNNTFVAVGVSGNIHRSTDNGTTWDNMTFTWRGSDCEELVVVTHRR